MLQNLSYSVCSDGTLVKLRFGNVDIEMEYRTALHLAQLLRLEGRRAKALAGDTSMNLRGLGILSDAEEDIKRLQAAKDATAHFKVS